MATALIVLAAGKGTRMKSDLPKVLHPLAGVPLLAHALASGAALEPARTVVVVAHEAAEIEAAARDFAPEAVFATQAEQKGTGHAVLMAEDVLESFNGDIAVLFGDTPFIRSETLAAMAEMRRQADLVVLGFDTPNPGRYGRLVMRGDNLVRIVEFKDATDEERAITLCNSGVILGDKAAILSHLHDVTPSAASGEIYLTELPERVTAAGGIARVVLCDEAETMGVDSRADLARAEALFQSRARAGALENGVLMPVPDTVHFSHDTHLGRDCTVEPYVVFGPGVTVETGVRIRAFSHLEGAHVSRGAIVGPYARLRPGAELAENTRVGNFVEVKNAEIAEGAKVNHLSYIGDASIGAGTNIGAGTITCNYDGVLKHRTEIGREVFVGSNTMLVAPVRLGDRSMTASGSVITRDVGEGALAIARGRQVEKPGLAVRIIEKLRRIKNKG